MDNFLPIHQWFDQTKAFVPDARHRLVLHNEIGLILASKIFDPTGKGMLALSDGTQVSIEDIGTRHIQEDFGLFMPAQKIFQRIQLPVTLSRFNWLRSEQYVGQRQGGTPDDYQVFYNFFGLFAHHLGSDTGWALLCNAFGIYLLEQWLGTVWQRPSDGKIMPVRPIGERWVRLGYNNHIPTLQNVIENMPVEKWMFENAAALEAQFGDETRTMPHSSTDNPIVREHIASIQSEDKGS